MGVVYKLENTFWRDNEKMRYCWKTSSSHFKNAEILIIRESIELEEIKRFMEERICTYWKCITPQINPSVAEANIHPIQFIK